MITLGKDPKQLKIIIIMTVVTLLVPYANLFWFTIFPLEAIIGVGTYAVLWAIFPEHRHYERLQILHPYVIMGCVILGIFNILFGMQVVRYCMEKTEKKWLFLSGILTLVIPLYQAAIYTSHLYPERYGFQYLGPIPIQLIIGLIIARLYAPSEPESPWE